MKILEYFTPYSFRILLVRFCIQDYIYDYETHFMGNDSCTWSFGRTHYVSSIATISAGTTLIIQTGCVLKSTPGIHIAFNETVLIRLRSD